MLKKHITPQRQLQAQGVCFCGFLNQTMLDNQGAAETPF